MPHLEKEGTQAMITPIIYARQEPDTAHAGTWCDVPDGGTPYVPQAAIAAAMMGAVKLADGIAGNTKDYQADYRRAAGQIGALIKASIPTDAKAALAERERQAKLQGRREALAEAVAELKSQGHLVAADTIAFMLWDGD